MKGRRSVFASALAAGTCLLPVAARAQTAAAVPSTVPQAGQSSSGTGDETATPAAQSGLGDVVVTARRREENLQDVPLSVTAFTPEALANDRIASQADLANFTPSLFAKTGGYPQEFSNFALRGQGPAFGATPGTIVYFADVPNPISIDGRTGTYFDLANVQVLAGPQGTLFGKNATGGNILFQPQRPTNELGGYIQGEGGNLSDRRVEGAINLPIVDDAMLLRVSGELGRRDGYTKDVGPNFPGKDYDNLHYESVRASLIMRPTPDIEVYTIGRYFSSRTNGPGTVLKQFNNAFAASGVPALAIFPGLATAVAQQNARGNRRVAYDLDEFSKTTYGQLLNQTTINLSKQLTLKNIISYSELRYRYGYDYDATVYALAGQTSRTTGPTQGPNYFTEELQLQGKVLDDALNFVVGGYLDRQTLGPLQGGLFTQFPFSVFLGPIPATQNQHSKSYAAFGQATLDFTSMGLRGLSLTGGLRHTWDDTFQTTAIATMPPTGGEADFEYTSYSATLDYDIMDGVHAYVTSRDAFKAGGVNGPVPDGSPFRTFPPEKLQDVEVGVKSQFRIGDVQGRLNVAAYRGDYTNIQRTTTESVGGTFLNVTRSAAKGRIQGLEVTGLLVPVRGLTLNVGYSLTDSKYTKVLDATANAILAGSAFPYTPHDKVTLGGTYDLPVGEVGTFSLSANWAYQSRFSSAQTNTARVAYLPSYNTLSLRAGLRDIGGRPIDLSAFMANATDNEFATGLLDQYASSGFVAYTYSEPRTYGLQLKVRFGK